MNLRKNTGNIIKTEMLRKQSREREMETFAGFTVSPPPVTL